MQVLFLYSPTLQVLYMKKEVILVRFVQTAVVPSNIMKEASPEFT